MDFIVTLVKTDHSSSRETVYIANDIDQAARLAINSCYATEFVASVRQADLEFDLIRGATPASALEAIESITGKNVTQQLIEDCSP